jgi:hypothetical protein
LLLGYLPIWVSFALWFMKLAMTIEFPGYYDQIRVTGGMAGSGRHLTSIWDYNSELKVGCQDNAANAVASLEKLVGKPTNNYADGDRTVMISLFHQLDGIFGRISMTKYKSHFDALAAHQDAGRLKCVTMDRILDEMRYLSNPD